ncbi:hypothetical protein HQ584_01770 [Patescibacteria group bacterium]|nr:hypothetical protein [Patescibacteria group bacterium]
MVYPKEERNKHWGEIIDKYFDFEKGYVKITTEDIKKIIGDKEIRLLNYYDSKETMPQILREKNIMLFPNSTTSWWLVKCNGFVDLPPINSEIIKFKSKSEFLLKSSTAGMGEQQYLLNIINSGILKHFLGIDKPFYFTIMGKQRSKEFKLDIEGKSITIEKPGIEIDAGFEGEDFAIIVEAKAKIMKSFSRRQLYFPYIHVKNITGKKTTPVFFCWDNKTKTYNLWKFEISDDHIENINLVESKRYSLE